MKREVDKRKTSKALRKLRRVAERAEGEGGPGLTNWEKEFVEGVTGRLEKYGSAFRDPGKGRLEEALSARQAQVTRVIDKKSRKSKAGAEAPPAAAHDGEPVRTSQRKPVSEKSDAKQKSGLKPRSSFKPKSGPGWKPRGRDINDDRAAATPAAAPRPALKVIPGGKAR